MLFLYRTVDVDDDAAPLDFGAVRAGDAKKAAAFIEARLVEILGEAVTYMLYEAVDDGKDGVLGDGRTYYKGQRKK